MQKLILHVILFLVILFGLGWYFSDITLYFIFSIVIASALRPVTNRLNSIHILGQQLPRSLAILISFFLIGLVLFLMGLLFIPLFITQLEVIQGLDTDYIYSRVQ